jgi:hypothetical protein
MRHRHRYSLPSISLGLLFVLAACDERTTTPTTVECVNTTYVRANEPEYEARTEPATDYRGHLRKNCPAGGTYCYYLDTTPLNAGDTASVLEQFVGTEVIIIGKRVNATSGVELWPAAICKLQCNGGSVPCFR